MKFPNLNSYSLINSIAVLLVSQLFGVLPAHAAYTIPETLECQKDGYYHALTEPSDIPNDYSGSVTLHTLPKNICVRRLPDSSPDTTENFTKFGIIPIAGSALAPLKGVTYNAASYEALVGHFANGTPSTTDFKGLHSFLIHKTLAIPAVHLEGGVYYIDKQSRIGNDNATAVCPQGYSTIGSSKICYSQKNALKLNSNKKVELIDLTYYFDNEFKPISPDERCPLGMTMDSSFGSNGGICMPVQVILHEEKSGAIQNYGVDLPYQGPNDCGQFMSKGLITASNASYISRCMPALTAITCKIDESSRAKFPMATFPGSHATALLDTMTTELAQEFPTRLSSNISKMTQSKISISAVNKMLAMSSKDEEFILPSSANGFGKIPIWVLHTDASCATFWAAKMSTTNQSGGYSLEPFASTW
jgi:hypothetical protein